MKFLKAFLPAAMKLWPRLCIMFLLVSVILLTGGRGLPQCMLGRRHLSPRKEAPREGNTPPEGGTLGKEALPGKEALREGGTPPPRKKHPPGRKHPPTGIRSMSSRYASYWNSYLLYLESIVLIL